MIGATVMAVIAIMNRGIIVKVIIGIGTSIGGMTDIRNAAMSVPSMFRRRSITNLHDHPESVSFSLLIMTARGL